MNYLITGLPRSRTAWLAAVLSTESAPCLHEGLVLGVDGLNEWMADNPNGGDSDSGLPMFWQHLSFPYRLVVIRRDPKEVAESYARVTGFEREIAELAIMNLKESLEEWASTVDHLSIDYRDLSENRVVQSIIDYCRGTKIGHQHPKSDMTRIQVFQELQIEQRGLKGLAGDTRP